MTLRSIAHQQVLTRNVLPAILNSGYPQLAVYFSFAVMTLLNTANRECLFELNVGLRELHPNHG